MGLFGNLFSAKKSNPINSYADFWNWFLEHEKRFHKIISEGKTVNSTLFAELSSKLEQLPGEFMFLAGISDAQTAEIVFTADGNVKDIVFNEELVANAPIINGWLFTALKQSMDSGCAIEMSGYSFDESSLSFYSIENPKFPDEINVIIVHNEFTEQNRASIKQGVYIFLDNFLGELNFASLIDDLDVEGIQNSEKELIPIEKLNAFLIWREKEFVEKYDSVYHSTENDQYSIFEGETTNGNALIAAINTDILKWDAKASHPWVATVEILFDGSKFNGMPDPKISDLLEEVEDEILNELKDSDGYLNIGRQTCEGSREIYIACKEFRKPSKVISEIVLKHAGKLELNFQIGRDKYWRSMDHFNRG